MRLGLAAARNVRLDTARDMEELLERTRLADEALAQQARDAVPAGDPDPYKEPESRGHDDHGSTEER